MGQLVLSRFVDEKIVIGEGLIVIQVVRIQGDKVRIGIDAPRDMSVHRAEVYEAIQRDAEAEAIRRENNPSRGPLP